jgi:hypothetical protein
MAPDGQAAGEPPLGNTRRWAITVTVMVVGLDSGRRRPQRHQRAVCLLER